MTVKIEDRAQLREYLARILHDANTGRITPDPADTTKYGAMADALIEAGFETLPDWEYGWAPHAVSRDKFPTEEEAKEAYYMAVGQPPRRWKRRVQSPNPWVLADD